jgi:hypothetical protein
MMRDGTLQVGTVVRYRKRGSALWREGVFERWSYSPAGNYRAQIRILKVDEKRIHTPYVVYVKPSSLQVQSADWIPCTSPDKIA